MKKLILVSGLAFIVIAMGVLISSCRFLDKYNSQLKEKGFETNIMKIGNKGGSIAAETERYVIFLMGGEGNVSLGVTVKKQE